MVYHKKFIFKNDNDIILFDTDNEIQLLNVLMFINSNGYDVGNVNSIIKHWKKYEHKYKYIRIDRTGTIFFVEEEELKIYNVIKHHSFIKIRTKI